MAAVLLSSRITLAPAAAEEDADGLAADTDSLASVSDNDSCRFAVKVYRIIQLYQARLAPRPTASIPYSA